MSYIAPDPQGVAIDPKTNQGRVIGDGQCVAFVRRASGAPDHKQWKRGLLVKETAVLPGAAIATFDADGKYGSRMDGTCHAAIYIETDKHDGIHVWDQWLGQPAHQRWIRFQNHAKHALDGKGNPILDVKGNPKMIRPINDGDNYYVID